MPPPTAPSTQSSSSPCPGTFPVIYLGMRQGEMIRAAGAVRTESLTSGIKPGDFCPPEPLHPPRALHPKSRDEVMRHNSETNLSCPFQDVALKIHFLVCSASTECAWVGGGWRAGRVSAHHPWLSHSWGHPWQEGAAPAPREEQRPSHGRGTQPGPGLGASSGQQL